MVDSIVASIGYRFQSPQVDMELAKTHLQHYLLVMDATIDVHMEEIQ